MNTENRFRFRQTVDHLRREHEQTVQRLKELQREEISTAMDVTTHTRFASLLFSSNNFSSPGIFVFVSRAFGSVIDHMEQNAKNIDELRLKLESKHHSVLTEKEIETRAKEQQLKGKSK